MGYSSSLKLTSMDIGAVEAIWLIQFRYVNEYVLWPPNRTNRRQL